MWASVGTSTSIMHGLWAHGAAASAGRVSSLSLLRCRALGRHTCTHACIRPDSGMRCAGRPPEEEMRCAEGRNLLRCFVVIRRDNGCLSARLPRAWSCDAFIRADGSLSHGMAWHGRQTASACHSSANLRLAGRKLKGIGSQRRNKCNSTDTMQLSRAREGCACNVCVVTHHCT